MKLSKYVIDKIKMIREEKGLSPEELGKLMDRNGNFIRGIELGNVKIGVLHIIKFCGAVGINPNDFYAEYSCE